MLFASICTVIPVTSHAAQSDEVKVNVLSQDKVITDVDTIKEICTKEYALYGSKYHGLDFENAQEMLDYEIGRGYIDSIETANYSLFINRYTGFVYYRNNKTGQILTSNPIDPAYKTQNSNNVVSLGNTAGTKDVLGQIEVKYFQVTDVKNKGTYTRGFRPRRSSRISCFGNAVPCTPFAASISASARGHRAMPTTCFA